MHARRFSGKLRPENRPLFQEPAPLPPSPALPSSTRGWLVTGLLMAASMISFLDRHIVTLMVAPLERDLRITDLQFALLTGGAFGLFYTLAGVPLAWLADHGRRTWIIATGVTLWSVMTMLCGMAGSFAALFAARLGVGVGEATLSPAAWSMLADLFDRKRLPAALGLYAAGLFIGAGVAMMAGGQIVDAVETAPALARLIARGWHGWQVVFLAVGLPGLGLAVPLALLREPERHAAHPAAGQETLGGFVRAWPCMVFSLLAGAGLLANLTCADAWYPELFMRSWGWSATMAGRVNGGASLIFGPLGLWMAARWSGRMMARGHQDACLRLTALAALGSGVPAVLMPLMPVPWAMALMLCPIKVFLGFTPMLIPAAIQMVSPPHLRARMGALFLLSTGLLGTSCGPLLPAFLGATLFPGADGLRLSLSVSAGIMMPLAMAALMWGAPQFRMALARVSLTDAG